MHSGLFYGGFLDSLQILLRMFYRPLIERPGELKGKCADILAYPYPDLRQNLSDILDVLIRVRWERDVDRDAASVEREK